MKQFIRVIIYIFILFCQIAVNILKIDPFVYKCFAVGSVGIQIRYEYMHRVRFFYPYAVFSVSEFFFFYSHISSNNKQGVVTHTLQFYHILAICPVLASKINTFLAES